MNRQDRRRLAAEAAKKPLPPARSDGRPLYYEIGGAEKVQCFICLRSGLVGITHTSGQAFMNDPANSPDGSGDMHTICLHHLPENAVVYNPVKNQCRDKYGENSWTEG